MQSRYFALSAAGILCGLFVFSSYSQAQTRIQGAVSDQHTITLTGNHHPLARPEFDAGPVAPDFVMGRMILALQPSADRASALDALLAAQQDPSSPQYHQWLTPDEFASQFGVSQTDLQQVTQWLNGHGFTIEEVPAGSQSIVFSGTAAQVETAFHTSIHSYNVGGKTHHANATDPQIPEALAGVIAGAVSLHDFQRKPLHARIESAPAYTTGTTH